MKELNSWYQLDSEVCLAQMNSSMDGLGEQEVAIRREKFGYNELPIKKPSVMKRLLRQFNSTLVFILLAAALVTGILTLLGEDMLIDTTVILGVVVLNAVLGFFQEGKAEGALAALQHMMTAEATVVRAGQLTSIAARELVPGDVILLQAGDKVPADLRLCSSQELSINESALTGESVPVSKRADSLLATHVSVADQTCMAFSGTYVTKGLARALVVETGLRTEFGKIADMMRHTATKLSPLQRKITDFTSKLINIILVVGLVNFILGALLGYSWIYSFLASVSLVVAAIPEMLPMIVTAILAFGATRMAQRNALIRRLPAAETLGCTTVICSDKTGTLTRNEMMVTRIWADGQEFEVTGTGYESRGSFLLSEQAISAADKPSLAATLVAGSACNDASIDHSQQPLAIIGDPTEAALKVSAERAGLHNEIERLAVIPFDSEKMLMATLDRRHNGQRFIHVKGAPEQVLKLCGTVLLDGEQIPLDEEKALRVAQEMASRALRVLAMARLEVDPGRETLELEDLQGLCLLGYQGMIDPPRPEAIEAIAQCREAGIRTVMITGDHLATAKAIAAQMGIGVNDKQHPISGQELEELDAVALARRVEEASIYARVAPADKLRIAQTLQTNGHIVAMTGDGVNDAPALKAADIGVAMGINGTEVTKEAADMVLVDDNFATIVGAVEEGRHAWNNLEKAILYTLPTNGGQALLVMGAVLLASFVPLFSLSLPLEPVQILWINLFDSVFLTMPLMMEAKEGDLLHSAPRSQDEGLATPLLLQRVLLIGLTISLCGFVVFYHFGSAAVVNNAIADPLLVSQAQTAAFWAVLLVHFGFVMSARSVYKSAFSFNPFSNRWLLLGILVSFLARLAPTFSPTIGSLFRTVPFPADWWWWILPCVLPGFVVLEIDKWLRNRYR
jgi:magnesium-transporting ATPase (P-type)